MRTLDSNIITELQAYGLHIIPVLKLYLPDGGGTLLLAGKDYDDLGGVAADGRIDSWTPFGISVDPKQGIVTQALYTIVVSNVKKGSLWQSFVGTISGYKSSQIRADLIIYFGKLKDRATYNIELFSGYVENLESYNELTCRFSVADGLKHIDTILGDLIEADGTLITGLIESAENQVQPLIWGKVKYCPSVCFAKAPQAVLAQDIEDDDTDIYFTDLKLNENEWGTDQLAFIGRELVKYSTVTIDADGVGGHLSGCTRGYLHTIAEPHGKGAYMVKWCITGYDAIPHRFFCSGHAVQELEEIRVNDRPVPDVDFATFKGATYTPGWGGKCAYVEFNRNPIYPDEERGLSIRNELFNVAKSGNSAEDAEFCWDGDSSTFAKIGNGQKLRVGFGDGDWYQAEEVLGRIVSAKVVVRYEVKLDDEKNPYLEPWDGTLVARATSDTGTTPDRQMGHPALTCDDYAEWLEFGTSVSFDGNSDIADNHWTGPYHEGSAIEEYSEDQPHALCMVTWYSTVAGFFTVKVRVPKILGKIWGVFRAEACINYRHIDSDSTGDVMDRFSLHLGSGYYTPQSRDLPQGDTGGYRYKSLEIEPFNIYPQGWYVIDREGFEQIDFNFGNTVSLFTGLHHVQINRIWSLYHYWPCDYKDITTREEEVDVSNSVKSWADLDSLAFELEYNGDDKHTRVKCLTLVVDYAGYDPASSYVISANVTGRKAEGMGAEKEYAEKIMLDILKNWVLARAPPGYDGGDFFSIDEATFTNEAAYKIHSYRYAEQRSALAVLAQLAYESINYLFFRNLEWICHHANELTGASVWDIGDDDIIRGSFSVKPGRPDEVLNYIETSYQYNPLKIEWGATQLTEDATSQVDYGVKKPMINPIPLYSLCLNAPSLFLWYHLNKWKEKPTYYQFRVRPEGYKLQRGDWINITYSPLDISSERVMVIALEYGPGILKAGDPPAVLVTAIQYG